MNCTLTVPVKTIFTRLSMIRGAANRYWAHLAGTLNPSMATSIRTYETLVVKSVAPFVTHVEINRPDKLNAMNKTFWR